MPESSSAASRLLSAICCGARAAAATNRVLQREFAPRQGLVRRREPFRIDRRQDGRADEKRHKGWALHVRAKRTLDASPAAQA